MKLAHVLVLGFACVLPLAASAQWQWVDSAGKTVFSDQPPSLDVPEKNIVRRPANARGAPRVNPDAVPPAGADAATAAPQPAAASAPKPTGVDKELEEKARKAADAEKARKAAEEAKIAKAKADNCAQARQSKSTFDSGIRVARVNASGEREILDDAQRAAEVKRAQAAIDQNCR
ncbi:DUF4124 domain-containing protein [Variovorax sp. dw_308]|uniref:DUF4124 domain-containing protein n=1 Tax=Variovorax sp. dw_308 TaxID=2721546 RepID=UPI001C463292|nr:DUF4124 domain-containing protein [Variovorax sp. dw_308]